MLILDGGLASQLQSQGFIVEGDPLWSARALVSQFGLESLRQAHLSFLEAGADIITTASYQCNVPNLKDTLHISEQESIRLIKLSVGIAYEACQIYAKTHKKPTFVAASIGPYGACLHNGSEYTGLYVDTMTTDELKAWHRPRLLALLETDCDFLAIETIPALKEAQALLELLHELAPNRKAWISFSCKDDKRTCHGEIFSEVVNNCWTNRTPGLLAIGINCTSPDAMQPLVHSCHESNAQFILYPNSGEVWDDKMGWSGAQTVANFLHFAPHWLHFQLFALGGCCRVLPDNITALCVLLGLRSS